MSAGFFEDMVLLDEDGMQSGGVEDKELGGPKVVESSKLKNPVPPPPLAAWMLDLT